MADNPQLEIRLTHDDNEQRLLHVEGSGYYLIPPHILSALKEARTYFPETHFSEMSARFILHAMLGNQASVQEPSR